MTARAPAQAAAQPQSAQQIPASPGKQIEHYMADPRLANRIAAALAGYIDPVAFRAQCSLAAADPNLAGCSAASLMEAFLVCAQMGLLPGKHHSHVALIPRVEKERGKVVNVMPQWQGFKFLMERQPGIKRVQAVLVHTTDDFAWDGATDTVLHRFDPLSEERQFRHPESKAAQEFGTGLRGGYLRIVCDDGEVRFHFVSAAKIDAARKCAETSKVWERWFEAQCLKTVFRDAWARRAVNIDPVLEARVGVLTATEDATLGNDPQRVEALPAATTATPALPAPRQTGMEKLKEQVGVMKAQAEAAVEVPALPAAAPDPAPAATTATPAPVGARLRDPTQPGYTDKGFDEA